MSRASVLALSLVLACATLAAGSASARPAALAQVRVVTLKPLTVRGVHFTRGERVRVSASTGSATRVRRVLTGPTGGFTVAFADLPYDRCSTRLTVVAVGAHGEHAFARLAQRECPPA